MLIAGIVMFALGSVFQALGFTRRNQAGGWLLTTGVITELRPTVSREFGSSSLPKIRYTLPGGQTIEAEASTAAAEEDGEVVGAEVPIKYKPDDPQQVVIDNGGAGVAAKALIGIGIACDVIGAVLILLSAL
jgi:hypothetical protein